MYAEELLTMQDELCPTQHKLRSYLSGRLETDDLDKLEAHLQSCLACEQAATAIENEPDTFVDLLQNESPPIPESSRSVGPNAAGNTASVVRFPLDGEIASYELIRELGSGGMGAVYLARHTKLDKQVAIKLLPALPAKMPEFVARFEREMRAAGRLEHPAIVRTTDAGEVDGVHYLVMEAIDGLDLSRIARSAGQMSIADACDVARQAALGLAHAHENGIVHRDVKPSNLMLDADGQLRILDFGLAQVGMWERGSAEITTVGQLMGTLDYMAPEQAERGGAVDYRADLYSLGATLFRLLSGRPPLAAAPDMTPLEKLRLLSTHSAPQLSILRPDTPPQLSKLIGSLLARNPDERPASASHAAEMLQPFCDGAQLGALVARARVEAGQPESSAVVAQLMAGPLAAQQQNQPSSTPDRSGSFTYWFVWAGALVVAAASIWFVVETGKGQLVIESVDANVDIKLRKDDKILEELRIQPGTKVTRLWGGKYEITLDTGSDSFSVSQDAFTIRRGETVVARITAKQESDAAETITTPAAAPADERLDKMVYKGETLDTWLRRIKYERSAEQLDESLKAVVVLATPELKELIDPVMLELLSKRNEPLALKALCRTNGSEVYHTIKPVFDAASGRGRRSVDSLAQLLSDTLSISQGLESAKAAAPLLNWIDANFDEIRTSVKLQSLLLRILEGQGWLQYQNTPRMVGKSVDEVLENLLSIIHKHESKSRSMRAAVDRSVFFHGLRVHSWPTRVCVEATKRALRLLAGKDTDATLRYKASALLAALKKSNFNLPTPEKEQLVAILDAWLHDTAADTSYDSVSLRGAFQSVGSSYDLPKEYQIDSRSRITNLALTAMYVVDEFRLASQLEEPLQRLHDAVAECPIGEEPNLGRRASIGGVSFERFAGDGVARRVFYRSGNLLGIPEDELAAREQQVRPADREQYAIGALEFIMAPNQFFGTSSALGVADSYLSKAEAGVAIPVLIELIQRTDLAPDDGRAAIGLLSRVSGGDFFKHFAQILRSNPQFAAKYGKELWSIPELGGENADSLTPLFEWTDEVFRKGDNAQCSVALMLLSSLLRDRSSVVSLKNTELRETQQIGAPISAECQEAIIGRLETYTFVTDKRLWLSEPPYPLILDESQRWDRPLCEAMVRHAIETLEQSSDPELVCRALMALKSYALRRPLPRETLRKLPRVLRSKLEEAIGDLDGASSRFVYLSEQRWARLSSPQALGLRALYTNRKAKTIANETVLVIELVGYAGLVRELTPQLNELHESAVVREITTSYYRYGLPWDGIAEKTEAALQAILLSTGKLLGRELDELRELPGKRAAKAKALARITAQSGDTLAIYIEGILPVEGSPIPVMQAGTADPVIGYPIPVSSSGIIVVPLLSPLKVRGMQLDAIQKLITKSYEDQDIFAPGKSTITVDMLSKAGAKQELRSLSSPSAAAKTPM